MTAPAGAVLYTPELLALAVSLADRPFDPTMPCVSEARSRTCGSTLKLSCALDAAGRVDAVGLQVAACAVGQAAAAIFANGVMGRDRDNIEHARSQIAEWLSGAGANPDWPGFEPLAPVRAHPGRHRAVMLAWDAALAALSNTEAHG